MNKRLNKLHMRKVARARERGQVSAPDVRTAGELTAARAASRAVGRDRADHRPIYTTAEPPRSAQATLTLKREA